MKTTKMFLGVTLLALAGCSTSTSDTARTKATPAATVPTAASLLALDQRANQAFIQGDAKFFEETLSDKFVMYEGGKRVDKAGVTRMVAGNKCDVKDWKLEDPRMARINEDTYMLSYQGTFAGSCAGPDGNAMRLPSTIRAATVWVRSGDRWQAAFHGENVLAEPKNPPPVKTATPASRKKSNSVKPGTDPITNTLMALEKSLWEAWKDKDAKRMDELTAPDLAFQNIFGTYFPSKAEALKDWTGPLCDVKRVSISDGAGVLLSPTVGMLTRTGTAEGTCGGQKIASVPIYGVSIFVKDGDSWKLAFSLNQL